MKKFKAPSYSHSIKVVEVERETETSVWINGRRNSKRTQYDNFFDTWGEAFHYLLERAETKLCVAQGRLNWAQDDLRKVKRLTPKDT